jgi:hypothetical protein
MTNSPLWFKLLRSTLQGNKGKFKLVFDKHFERKNHVVYKDEDLKFLKKFEIILKTNVQFKQVTFVLWEFENITLKNPRQPWKNPKDFNSSRVPWPLKIPYGAVCRVLWKPGYAVEIVTWWLELLGWGTKQLLTSWLKVLLGLTSLIERHLSLTEKEGERW